jgi:DNA helicase HerA-like ATPase
MTFTTTEEIGIVLEGGTHDTVKALIRLDHDIKIGEILLIEDKEGNIGLAQVEKYEYINEFYTNDSPLIHTLMNSRAVIDLLKSKTVILSTLKVIRSDKARVSLPGNLVKKLPNNAEEYLYGEKLKDPRYIKYGKLVNTEIPLLLNINSLPMHMGIFGETGSGKSYDMRYLIYLFSNIRVNGECTAIPMIVIDANGDYTDLATDVVKRAKLLECRKEVVRYTFTEMKEHFYMDLNVFSTSDLSYMIISSKYMDSTTQASLQLNLLELTLNELYNEGYDFNVMLGSKEGVKILEGKLEEIVSNRKDTLGYTVNTKRAVLNAIHSFVNKVERFKLISTSYSQKSFNEDTLEEIFRSRALTIIDFSATGAPGMDIVTKQMVVGYIARLLYNYLVKRKMNGENRFIAFVIEEAQNYIPSSYYPINAYITKDILATIATQGRKFGASLILISQRPAFVDKVVLSMLNSFIFHRIYHEDVEYIRSVASGLSDYIARELVNLPRGQAVVTGLINPLEIPARVVIPFDKLLESSIGSEGDIISVLSGGGGDAM